MHNLCFFIFINCTLQVYPDGKMSQYFASLKPGDVVEVKGYYENFIGFLYMLLPFVTQAFFFFNFARPIEKLRYSPNMKKQIGMVR